MIVEDGLAENQNNEKLLLQKGFILINLQRLDEAEAFYIDLVKRMPDQPEPMNNLGATYQLQNKLTAAVRQFNETIQKFPDFVAAYENLGDTYVRIAANQYAAGSTLDSNHKTLLAKARLSHQFQLVAQQHSASSPGALSTSPSKAAEKIKEDIVNFLESWVNDWSSRETDRYFAHYSSECIPLANKTLKAWKKRKTAILNAAKYIKIRIQEISISQTSDGVVEIMFSQSYESDRYSSTSPKKLVLSRQTPGSPFLIIREE
ncbi:MAG: hypothetical protein GKR95_12695 [Gammaproteobacteria bacterium]|nr:hypothetical protein [Gammaproteobacteria bacterium]